MLGIGTGIGLGPVNIKDERFEGSDNYIAGCSCDVMLYYSHSHRYRDEHLHSNITNKFNFVIYMSEPRSYKSNLWRRRIGKGCWDFGTHICL